MQNMKNPSYEKSPRVSTRYAKEEKDVITMIVDNFCNQAQDGLSQNKQMGDIRRKPGYEEPKIDLTRVSQTSDLETAR